MKSRRLRSGLALVCAIGVLLSSCHSPAPGPPPAAHTLAADHRIPAADIERLYSPEKWQRLRDLEYAAVVVMDGFVRADGSLRVSRIRRPFPDPEWINLARSYVPEIVLHAATIGSNLSPRAELYVIFFKPGFDGSLVLIYARQTGAPPPGMADPAVYFHATHY